MGTNTQLTLQYSEQCSFSNWLKYKILKFVKASHVIQWVIYTVVNNVTVANILNVSILYLIALMSLTSNC